MPLREFIIKKSTAGDFAFPYRLKVYLMMMITIMIMMMITIKITIMLMIMIMKIIMIKMFNYPCPFHVNVYLNGAVQLQVY